jgi:hypothetical protein
MEFKSMAAARAAGAVPPPPCAGNPAVVGGVIEVTAEIYAEQAIPEDDMGFRKRITQNPFHDSSPLQKAA